MAEYREGILAVGVEYEGFLPILGPTPQHEGRVWSSADGRTWEDVTPHGIFANTRLSAVIRRADATLLAVGTVSAEDEMGGVSVTGFGAWESEDGRSWTPSETGLPEDRWIVGAVQGERGVLANVWQVGATHGSEEVWFSSDGRGWKMVRLFGDGPVDFDAGEEGFVIAGTEGPYGGPGTPFAIASGNGHEWFDASIPPEGAVSVAAIGPDWVILTVAMDEAYRPTSVAIWQSANGLSWSGPDDIEIELTDPESGCPLWPSLLGEGRSLILRSYWSGLCSEGAARSFGPHLLSLDGQAWSSLPFPKSGEGGSGSWVNASAVLAGALVLAGESNRQAAFWLGQDQ
jgi:hypothetical protein